MCVSVCSAFKQSEYRAKLMDTKSLVVTWSFRVTLHVHTIDDWQLVVGASSDKVAPNCVTVHHCTPRASCGNDVQRVCTPHRSMLEGRWERRPWCVPRLTLASTELWPSKLERCVCVCVCGLRHYCTNRVKCPGGSDQLVLQPFYPDHGRRWLCHTPSTGAIEWAPH